MRGAGRREIGHGALAERAISAVLPTQESWPYAMRVVSDILESNGSSSMATVLRGFAFADGCWSSTQGSGGWRCYGIGEGRRAVCHPDGHCGGRKIITATWISRSLERKTGSPRCRWILRLPASLRRSCGKRWHRRSVGGCISWGRWKK